MNASEKFSVLQGIEITMMRNGAIPLEHVFFKGRRKVMRGLEENIIREKNRQYGNTNAEVEINYEEENVYRIKNAAGVTFYVQVDKEWITIGSDCMF